ncbi:PRDX6 [Cordylochernes scorpioides]|uniref:PRDX6 n=1 Tax=Cordylochernes scorpioides TaxID=51811 RepID=A0ABY6K045_9ARAC|nr:PRDX6 [Cordylochernes scorpioides]
MIIVVSSWAILFSHPADYTPVCTTELARLTELQSQFKKRNVKLIALSCDTVDSHKGWSKDIESITKSEECHIEFPIISDHSRDLAIKLKMLDPVEKDAAGMPLTCRAADGRAVEVNLFLKKDEKKNAYSIYNILYNEKYYECSWPVQVFVIGPDKTLKLSILYPATTGRNFDEILRAVDSLQLTTCKKVATPVNWKPGDEVIVVPSVKDEELPALFPQGVKQHTLPSGKNYLRYTKC